MALAMEPVAQMPQLEVPAAPLPLPPPPPPPPPPFSPVYKRHRNVCNKEGFMSWRALGGHTRAHGIPEDELDDDTGPPCGGGTGDSSSQAASPSSATKRMYELQNKSCRVCENCGKEFASWKSLLDHGRCNYDEEHHEGMVESKRSPPPRDADADDGGEVEDLPLAAGWSKGKRTRRAKVMAVGAGSGTEATYSSSEEEKDLANCLVMLSSSRSVQPLVVVVDAEQESCASARKDAERNGSRKLGPEPVSTVMAPAAMPELKMLAPPKVVPQPAVSTVPRGLFQCNGCMKVFISHQALGGHRASHKKVKGCYAANLQSNRNETSQPVKSNPAGGNIQVATNAVSYISTPNDAKTADAKPMNTGTSMVTMATAASETAGMRVDGAPAPSAGTPIKKKGKVHECSICHRVFMSGQALGGHKRCHCLTTGSGEPIGAVAKVHHPFVDRDQVMHARRQQLTLGLPLFDDAAAHPPILDLNVQTNTVTTTAADPIATNKQAAELKDSLLCLNAPAPIYMQSWTNASKMTATSSCNDMAGAAATEDEADSRNAGKGKIRDLRNMNMAGETSPWLQVGIGLPSEGKDKSTRE